MLKLKRLLPKKSGRGFKGRVTTRHQGGRQKRFLRIIDFKRVKKDLVATVRQIEYDPNRSADVALIQYLDGSQTYIVAPVGLVVGAKVIASPDAPIEAGNSLPLSKIPVGTSIHNLEITPGKGGQLVRGAGSVAIVHGKEEEFVLIRMPSGEIRRFNPESYASIGQVGNEEARTEVIRLAGRKRRMGIRPTVRGVAQNPHSHPHGGGEGRSGIGMNAPKTVYGKSAVGKTRKKVKYSDRFIVVGRKKGPHN